MHANNDLAGATACETSRTCTQYDTRSRVLSDGLQSGGRSVKLCARRYPDVYSIGLSNPHMRVNYPAPDFIPLEKRILPPPCLPVLEQDCALTGKLHKPESLAVIEALLEQRQRLEAQADKEPFRFELLMPTLRNMQTFIDHIRQGKQFTSALTAGDHTAMAWLAEQTQVLLDAGAPYKRTVQLAFALLAVCEAMTNRWILHPLEKKQPDFFRWHCEHLTLDVEPEDIVTFSWGGNNATATPERQEFFAPERSRLGQLAMSEYLDRADLLLYPSFQPLDLADFCRFGHLPVYPIGMTTTYVTNADGILMSPLTFALHDVFHTRQLSSPQHASAAESTANLLSRPSQRLAWRQLLLDRTPVCLDTLISEDARILMLFLLFHEHSPQFAVYHLDLGLPSFLGSLKDMGLARRTRRAGYSKAFQQVTDTQASMSVIWTIRLWELWKSAGHEPLAPEQLERLSQQFLNTDAPRLLRHLQFIDRHRGTLRQLFAESCVDHHLDGDRHVIRVHVDQLHRRQRQVLFESYDPYSGLCNLDNTDMAYFSALQRPASRRTIEERTGARLPEGMGYQPEIPALQVLSIQETADNAA